MADPGQTDAFLVEAVRRGDSKAFDRLVRRHLRTAHAVAAARLKNTDDADDVVQDAFIKALQRIDELGEPSRFKGWLLTIVKNTAHNRRDYNRVRDAQDLETVSHAASTHDPAKDAYRGELRGHLQQALSHLTELQRRVLVLHDLEGWKHDEIAEELGISGGSSRVHLHVARKAMRKRLRRPLALGV